MSTEEREVYLMDTREATNESHTGVWIKDYVLEVSPNQFPYVINASFLLNPHSQIVDLVGRDRICAIVSDSTGNTRLHRELLVEEIPTLFNLPDIVHLISNTIKDLVKLDYFKETTTTMRSIIVKFHKSHEGTAELAFAHVECGIGRGLESIGKTRFGTMILAAWALDHNLPAIKRVVERGRFDLGVR